MNLNFNTRSLRISFEEKPEYLALKVEGEYDLQDIKILIRELHAEHTANGLTRILADMRGMTGEMPNIDRYDMGLLIAGLWDEPLKVGILSPPERINKLLENTAVNRYARLKVHYDEKLLMEWLLSP